MRADTIILTKRHAHFGSADAAVATSAALNVTEPSSCGIGGSVHDVAFDCLALLTDPYRDAFCLFYDAKSKTVQALNGSGRSPEKLNIDYVRKQGVMGKKIPHTNLNSVTVPGAYDKCHAIPLRSSANVLSGAAAAWVDTVEKFGSGTLTISEIFEPAIRLAEEG